MRLTRLELVKTDNTQFHAAKLLMFGIRSFNCSIFERHFQNIFENYVWINLSFGPSYSIATIRRYHHHVEQTIQPQVFVDLSGRLQPSRQKCARVSSDSPYLRRRRCCTACGVAPMLLADAHTNTCQTYTYPVCLSVGQWHVRVHVHECSDVQSIVTDHTSECDNH